MCSNVREKRVPKYFVFTFVAAYPPLCAENFISLILLKKFYIKTSIFTLGHENNWLFFISENWMEFFHLVFHKIPRLSYDLCLCGFH